MRFSEHTQLNKRWVHWLHKMTVKYHQKLQKNFYKSGNDDSRIDDDIIDDYDASDNGQQMLQNSEERQKRCDSFGRRAEMESGYAKTLAGFDTSMDTDANIV